MINSDNNKKTEYMRKVFISENREVKKYNSKKEGKSTHIYIKKIFRV